MTVLELYIDVRKVATTRAERQKVEAVLDSYPQVDMAPSISRRAGRLLGERMAAAGMAHTDPPNGTATEPAPTEGHQWCSRWVICELVTR